FWATRPHAYSHSRHARYPGNTDGIDRDIHGGHSVDVEQLLLTEVVFSLERYPIWKICLIGRVVCRKYSIEIFFDGQDMKIVAEIRKPLTRRLTGRRSGKDEVVPVHAIAGSSEMGHPAVGRGHDPGSEGPSQLLIQEPKQRSV